MNSKKKITVLQNVSKPSIVCSIFLMLLNIIEQPLVETAVKVRKRGGRERERENLQMVKIEKLCKLFIKNSFESFFKNLLQGLLVQERSNAVQPIP